MVCELQKRTEPEQSRRATILGQFLCECSSVHIAGVSCSCPTWAAKAACEAIQVDHCVLQRCTRPDIWVLQGALGQQPCMPADITAAFAGCPGNSRLPWGANACSWPTLATNAQPKGLQLQPTGPHA